MRTLILIAVAFVSFQAVAQDKTERKNKAEHMKNMSAEDQATIMTKKLTLALDLTKEQQSQVKDIMLEQANYRKQKMTARSQVKSAKEVTSETKASRVEEINARLDRKIDMKKKMKSILTSEQYEKWENLQNRRNTRAKGKNKTKAKY